MSTEKDLHLDEDLCFANDLKYSVISFCSSESRQRIKCNDSVALKIRGAFASTTDAMSHVKLLKKDLDAYIMENFKWTLLGNVNPEMDTEEHLVDMIKAHKKKNSDAREEFQKRKDIVKKDGLEAYKDDAILDVTETTKEETPLHDIQPILNDETVDDGKGIDMNHIDEVKVADLNYAVISFVERDPENQTIETPRGCVGVKIRGVFATRKECDEQIEKLSKLDSEFDMYVVDLYRFLLLPPPDKDGIKTKYREPYLQELFSTYDQSQQEARAHIKERETVALLEELEKPTHPAEIKASGSGASGSGA